MSNNFKYDIALSFLSRDEGVAQQINDQLQDRYRTFIYTEQQKRLAGTDGELTFKRVFAEEARLVAVLFRPEWGTTSWTRVEQDAIRGRAHDKGYDFCTFIAMTDPIERPDWLPKIRLLYGLKRFGVSGAAVALEARLQEQGVTVHEETVIERGHRLQRIATFAQEAEQYRRSEQGVQAAKTAFASLLTELAQYSEKLKEATRLNFIFRELPLSYYLVAAPNAVLTLYWQNRYVNSLDEANLSVGFYDKVPRLPGLLPSFDSPRQLESMKFDFKLVGPSRPSWSNGTTEIAPDDMADYLMKRLMEHNEIELKRKNR